MNDDKFKRIEGLSEEDIKLLNKKKKISNRETIIFAAVLCIIWLVLIYIKRDGVGDWITIGVLGFMFNWYVINMAKQ